MLDWRCGKTTCCCSWNLSADVCKIQEYDHLTYRWALGPPGNIHLLPYTEIDAGILGVNIKAIYHSFPWQNVTRSSSVIFDLVKPVFGPSGWVMANHSHSLPHSTKISDVGRRDEHANRITRKRHTTWFPIMHLNLPTHQWSQSQDITNACLLPFSLPTYQQTYDDRISEYTSVWV